ncbi:NAD(P)/FAD-dependent oxidoreductase [Flavilitoribacter nigricans]|uniref:NADH:ubiquinone reductase (non-electrogenic) n=1 Tax=Flavilitoribacter nigricans (strain ATCC 23147 / DSM 23189 / NBRC 102662 / NCIMB 1420 / SS-2) TaxID=1122177 RepID=A0A2D0N8I9_FLAN2|nr:NAD(P)/FAD-dependent oxidoreductase [Flavilitoribacter nigricans]PHN04831.1 FAD-dependent oxidoreductase [Flavilitoribacter nigricans DSM 23189 = NBRC 102662]
MKTIPNIPDIDKDRVVIVGGGFAGLKLARKLSKDNFQVVLFDKHNYHQFQPLFYQVATAGLEPSAIAFPLRKIFQSTKDLHVRIGNVDRVEPEDKMIYTNLGSLSYDYLVLAIGADTNYFGNEQIRQHAIPMKSLPEALSLRNTLLANYEAALNEQDPEVVQGLLNVVIVGAGPTGVELAGAIAEMRKFVLPKDYPELDFSQMKVFLLEGAPNVLPGYSDEASDKSREYLKELGVDVRLDTMVVDYDGETVQLKDGSSLSSHNVIWAAGVKANEIPGLPDDAYGKARRLVVDRNNRVRGQKYIFCLGDQAYMETEKYPKGHPQVAQVALQQADLLATNLPKLDRGESGKEFEYKDKGSLATIGRNRAVADLPGFKFQGFFAWILWLFVHLMALVGARNRVLVFINWAWSYFTFDKSFRLLINPKPKERPSLKQETETEPVS